MSHAEQHLETLKRSYLYLRISLVGVVAAIFLAIAFTPSGFKPEDADILRSISHYYYSPARIVFTAALCAAALALVVISGSGVQSRLLDYAALLAPLIAIVPTRTLRGEVGPEAEVGACVTGWPSGLDCIPADQLAYVAVGFWVWVTLVAVILVAALGLGVWRDVRAGQVQSWWYWVIFVIGTATLALYLVLWWSPWSPIAQEGLQMWGHLIAAGTFFIVIMIVTVMEAVRQWFGDDTVYPAFLSRRSYAVIYTLLAVAFVGDIIAAVVLLIRGAGVDIGDAVFIVEVIGLVTFAVFWAVQTLEHAHDADGWSTPPPPSTWSASAAA